MKKYLLGQKIGMSQLIGEDGKVTPVTLIKAGPCTVIRHKTTEKDGYQAVVLGYNEVDPKKVIKAQQGQFKAVKDKAFRTIKEVRTDNLDGFDVSTVLGPDVFEIDEDISVRSKSIGRGYSGTIKRHGFRRGPMSHGSKSHRIPGSIGGGTSPGRVMKGKKMAGQYGNKNVTVKNLKVIKVDPEKGLIVIKGAVPGKRNNTVELFQK